MSNERDPSAPGCAERRRFLRASIAGAVLAAAPMATLSTSVWAASERRLTLHNLHTGERLSQPYWMQGAYLPDSLADINKVLRDHRSGEVYPIDPGLLDLLSALQQNLGPGKGYEVISGYRSPATNAQLRSQSSGVAKRSLHMQGKAIDIRMPGTQLAQLHRAAKSMKAGGVGLYTGSNFIHVDTGRVRYW
ncbi:MAG: DUF882 domain-containing protein [Halieaceae bacterium]|nr:DUF882 domain-containing protein [Halieaceae bacterium]MCP5164204.1 DUF882 domain-containing protein [Pseudomonadales bacterium]MCP5203521.1 DUF882 domain-containing protein [Pseudomonadales bacterium]